MRSRICVRSVYRSGNSLVVALPARHRKALKLKAGSLVQVTMDGPDAIVLRNVTSAVRGAGQT